MYKTFAAATLILAFSTALAFAAERPAELDGIVKAKQPYGSGSLSWLIFTAYEASLWTDARQWSMKEPFALTLVYSMSFSTDDMVERTIGEMQKTAPQTPVADLKRYSAELARAFPPVAPGDRITALHVPDAAVRFFRNGVQTAEIKDSAFAAHFFALWLSAKSTQPDLRAKLLSLTD